METNKKIITLDALEYFYTKIKKNLIDAERVTAEALNNLNNANQSLIEENNDLKLRIEQLENIINQICNTNE